MSNILAATKWISNADMIVDVVALGYIKPTDSVVDLTFGRGKWWSKYDHTTQGPFTAVMDGIGNEDVDGHAFDYQSVTIYHGDYRHLPAEWTGLHDVAVFDPPYVSMGGRATSTLPDFMDRYGLENAASTPELLQADNELGLREAMRITKPGGLILAKCAPYISSGVRKEGDWWARDAAVAMGLKVEDMLIHLGDARAQPKDQPCKRCEGTGNQLLAMYQRCEKCDGIGRIERKVKHARNNYSVLWILKKPPVRRRRGKVSG